MRRVPPEQLFPRRVAHRVLRAVVDQYNLAGVALQLNPDDPTQAFPGATAEEVRFYADGWDRGQAPIAQVFLGERTARVVVDRIRALVRPKHRRDVRPEELGIRSVSGRPDVDVDVDIAGVVDLDEEKLRTAPQRARMLGRRSGAVPRYVAACEAER